MTESAADALKRLRPVLGRMVYSYTPLNRRIEPPHIRILPITVGTVGDDGSVSVIAMVETGPRSGLFERYTWYINDWSLIPVEDIDAHNASIDG